MNIDTYFLTIFMVNYYFIPLLFVTFITNSEPRMQNNYNTLREINPKAGLHNSILLAGQNLFCIFKCQNLFVFHIKWCFYETNTLNKQDFGDLRARLGPRAVYCARLVQR